MPVRRNSPAVLIYVGVAVAQLVAVVLISGSGISIPGVILATVLFGFLALGQPLAWWILVLLNSIGLIALVVTAGSDLASSDHVLWGNVIVLFVTSLAMEMALLSPGMRRHVASRGLRVARSTPADSAAVPLAVPSARTWPPRAPAASRSSGRPRRP